MHLNNNLRVLMLEDSESFSELLKILLLELQIENIFIARNYEMGLAYFDQYQPDICLVDINLGEKKPSGIEFVEKIRENAPFVPVIYLTSNYTEDCYEQSRHTYPSGFMNKELSRFKLHQAIDLALMQPVAPKAMRQKDYVAPYLNQSNFFFKIGDIYKSISIDKVEYFFSDQKLTYAKVDQRNFPTTVQLKTLEKDFAPMFLRVHKSYLVNVKMIESLNPGESTLAISGQTLPIGYAYKKIFLEQLQLLK
jgi:DNA-binding LytR/AlgR family response regulator